MIYVKDLPESDRERRTVQHEDGPITIEGPPVFLYCPGCDGRYSATRGDYFWKDPDEPFVCGECREPLELVRERSSIEVVKS